MPVKRLFLPLLTLAALTLACSLAGQGVPTPAAPPPAATPRAYMPLPTQRRPPTLAAVPTYTSTPTLIVPTAFPTQAIQEEAPHEELPDTPLPNSLMNVTYCTMNGVELKMDAFFPVDTGRPAPALIYIHGGGWSAGGRHDTESVARTPALLQAGFAVFSIDYRLAPEHLFPAMIQDAKCAVRSIRARAAEYHIDPEHIGVWGASAGGHLAALLGTSDLNAGFDVGEYPAYSSRVQAVIDLYGPADLTQPMLTPEQKYLLTTAFPPDLYEVGSPVTHVTADDPPFLILHGIHDGLVPLEQSAELYSRLSGAGVSAQLVVVLNAGHGFEPEGGRPDPSEEDITQMMVDFFSGTLK